MKSLLRDWILAVGWYMALITIGLVLTLTISSAVGYLPYSDRPGPGWVGPSFSFGQLGYYASWGVLLLIPTAVYGTGLFAYHRVLKFLDAPALMIRLVAALTAGLISLLLAAGMGWYIAMAAFPAWVAAGVGAVWGWILLPRYLGPTGRKRTPSVQWTAIGLVLLAGPLATYRLFFAPSYGQTLQLSVVRVTENPDSPPKVAWEPELDPREAALLDSLFPHGRLERGITGSSSSGPADHQARMLVVVTAPLTTEARLRVPKGVSVVYIQQGDQWHPFPPDAPMLKERIRLGPGSKPSEMTFAWPGADPSRFKWQHD